MSAVEDLVEEQEDATHALAMHLLLAHDEENPASPWCPRCTTLRQRRNARKERLFSRLYGATPTDNQIRTQT